MAHLLVASLLLLVCQELLSTMYLPCTYYFRVHSGLKFEVKHSDNFVTLLDMGISINDVQY